jgi:hypothetical protein
MTPPQGREKVFFQVTGERALTFLRSLRSTQTPSCGWVPGSVAYLWGKPQPVRRVECGGGRTPPEIRHRKDQPGASEREKVFLPPIVFPIQVFHQRQRISLELNQHARRAGSGQNIKDGAE